MKNYLYRWGLNLQAKIFILRKVSLTTKTMQDIICLDVIGTLNNLSIAVFQYSCEDKIKLSESLKLE